MRYYKHLYLTEGLEKKKEKIIKKKKYGLQDLLTKFDKYRLSGMLLSELISK